MIITPRKLEDVMTEDEAPAIGAMVVRTTRDVVQEVRAVVSHYPLLDWWTVEVDGVRKPHVRVMVRRDTTQGPRSHSIWREVSGR